MVMRVSEIDRCLERWEMNAKDVHRRMILAPTPRERWHAVWLLAQGCTAVAVAEALERDPHTIGRWASAFGEGGPAALHQNSPDAFQHSKLHPALEGPVDSAVVSQFPGQTVPLAATAHPEDDAVQHPPGVGAFAPRTPGRVHIQDHRVNLLPQMVGNLPDAKNLWVAGYLAPRRGRYARTDISYLRTKNERALIGPPGQSRLNHPAIGNRITAPLGGVSGKLRHFGTLKDICTWDERGNVPTRR